MAAIAGVFWPSRLVAISDSSRVRFVSIAGGGTVAANAASKAAAATRA